MNLTLYHYWRSSASWRVRWALALKEVSYKAIAVNLLEGEEKKTEYLSNNPSGYVPTLLVDTHTLAESVAIIEWLDESYPKSKLLPENSFERALARRLAETINSGIQPLQNLDVQKLVSPEKDKQKKWTQHWVRRGLKLYESILTSSGNDNFAFSMGNEPSYPDLFLIPQMYSAYRNDILPSEFPICSRIYQNSMATEKCKESSPEAFEPK